MAKKNESRTETHEVATHSETAADGSHTGTAKPAGASSNKPIRVFRMRGVKVAVFENKTDQGTFHKATLQRIYRDGEEWKTTQSYGRDDLPIAILQLERAWEFILETEAQPSINGDPHA